MTIENVQYVRNIFRSYYPNKGCEVRLDNNFTLKERNQFVIWDDEHQLVICIERNNDIQFQRDQPYKVLVQDYDQIQDLSCQLTDDELYTVAKAFGYSDAQIANIKDKLTYTLEDYADGIGNHMKDRRDRISDL